MGAETGRLFVFGAGGHAKVIVEILEAAGAEVAGVFDDHSTAEKLWHYPVGRFPGDFDAEADRLIIAVGSNAARRHLADDLDAHFGLAIHPSVELSSRVSIGDGAVVMAGAIINSETMIGRHAIVNTAASIDHDCVIGDFAHISPNSTLCGAVEVGEGSQVGAGAVIIPGKKVGRWAMVGAGAVVIRDVPDGAVVAGNPARPL